MDKKPVTKDVRVTLRLPAALKKKIAAAAWADRRSVSDWMVLRLEQAVDAELALSGGKR